MLQMMEPNFKTKKNVFVRKMVNPEKGCKPGPWYEEGEDFSTDDDWAERNDDWSDNENDYGFDGWADNKDDWDNENDYGFDGWA